MFPKPKKRRKPKHNIMQYAKDYCQYCAAYNIKQITSICIIDPPHHISAKKMGGSSDPAIHDPSNLITLCRYHHDCAHRKVKGHYISPEQLREAKRIEEGN